MPAPSPLRVGVDVHLHDAVRDRLADLILARPGASVKNEVDRFGPRLPLLADDPGTTSSTRPILT